MRITSNYPGILAAYLKLAQIIEAKKEKNLEKINY